MQDETSMAKMGPTAGLGWLQEPDMAVACGTTVVVPTGCHGVHGDVPDDVHVVALGSALAGAGNGRE